ncbi:MAG: ATP-dependent RecD-like DNA helicase [Desulfovibrionales bacterium]
MTQIQAELITIIFSNPENGWVVARARVQNEPGQTTVVGCMPGVSSGDVLKLGGCWKEHAKFGRQFMVEHFEQVMPATKAGIKRYLGSGMIRGIGPVMAERLVSRFGEKILDILDEDPEQLLSIDGLGPKKLESIKSSWEEQRSIRNLMLFLQTHEVPPGFAGRIFRRYGTQAVARLKENPYDLAWDITGIGFKTADSMALKLGFEPDSPRRLEAALVHSLKIFGDKGHVFAPRFELLDCADGILGGVDRGPLEEALVRLQEMKRVKTEPLGLDDEAVYLSFFYRMEKDASARLHGILTHPSAMKSETAAKALAKTEEQERITLSEEQRQSVLEALCSKAYIITGGPGTGKTTITRVMVRAFRAQGLKVKLAAPTGRAAKRLSEATGFHAATIHRLLGFSPDGLFSHNEEKKLKADVLVVDEVSMLDLQLFLSLLKALPLTCRLIMIGDVNQLPSVGAGNVLRDLIQSGCVPTAVLTRIYRQARKSLIVVNAHRINMGQFPEPGSREAPRSDFFWIEQDDPQRIAAMIQQLVCERIPEVYGLDPKREIQVLSPMHKGEVGTQNLNQLLQERLNPQGRELRRGMRAFREGDRVLQVRNNYEKDVFNGDLGWIESFDEEESEVSVDMDGRTVRYGFDEMDELILAYAVSVHKSQGSEYPAVVMPVTTQHFILLQKNLLYTGLTRARRLAVLIGSKRAMSIALKNFDAVRRYSRLEERVRERMRDEG